MKNRKLTFCRELLALTIICLLASWSSSSAGADMSSKSIIDREVTFFHGEIEFTDAEVVQWTRKSEIEIVKPELKATVKDGDELGFRIDKSTGESEKIFGVVENGSISLSNGTQLSVSPGDSIFDIMVKLKLLYLKLYRPNFLITG